MDKDQSFEVVGDDWTGFYRCKKCGYESLTGGMVMQMFDRQERITYQRRYCMRCYILHWENAKLGELELITKKGTQKS